MELSVIVDLKFSGEGKLKHRCSGFSGSLSASDDLQYKCDLLSERRINKGIE